MKVTFDTTCFFDYFERNKIYIEKIEKFSVEGIVDIVKTTRVMNDTHFRAKEKGGESKIWNQIQSFPAKTIGTVGRWNHSVWNSGDVWGDDEHTDLGQKIKKCIPSAGIEDVDHLIGHVINKRDIFITNDKHFLEKKEELKNVIGVQIMSPKEFIEFMEIELKKKENK